MPSPKVTSTEELLSSDAKWISLQKINYTDEDGKPRVWECAERKTRGKSGIDAVAILAILRSKTNAFPLSTVIIEQYRPPIDKGETPEDAAIRELEEETGYKAEGVTESSPIVVCDPGMTNANMKLVVVSVSLEDKLETPDSKLDEGEHIVKRIVPLDKLNDELKGEALISVHQGFVVDARLSYFASGYEMAQRIRNGKFD
ncbi:hypothetical protein BV22DRAFT_1103507 [Leucogyrophana mollusca]|uniref:Uncharacterized protein n=1 Tax=Leucogyrophana mollusca TaxID=85980 RepID=A0ACB8BSX1_9AGAM|nr:hypothetical protein BV22DRAFT_1103507 [Leucogyrophana mollusca]